MVITFILREYGILEIQDSQLRFRYNLNSLRTEEKEIWLTAVLVDDGQWHTVKVSRYGSAAILTIDGGEGRRYNDSFVFEGKIIIWELSTKICCFFQNLAINYSLGFLPFILQTNFSNEQQFFGLMKSNKIKFNKKLFSQVTK